MRRVILLILLICAGVMPPFAATDCDTIPAWTTEMFWEKTFVPAGCPRSIIFDFLTPDTLATVTLDIPARPHDTLPPFPVTATLSGGGETATFSGDLMGLGTRDAVVVRLVRTSDSPWVYFSVGGVRSGINFALRDLGYGAFTVCTSSPDDVRASDTYSFAIGNEENRHDYRMIEDATPTFESVDALDAYLAASDDIHEGIYRYMDRDMDASYAVPGGYYELAVVRVPSAGPESYAILYLSGATHSVRSWHPLMPKGLLRRTEYLTGYDLLWLTPDGYLLNRECNADFGDGAVLTLRMPLDHSTMRFAKKLHKK